MSGRSGAAWALPRLAATTLLPLAAQVKAHDDGYSQVLWLDGVERKYIEEVGAINIFFKIDGKVVTPMLNGSILPGITRNCAPALPGLGPAHGGAENLRGGAHPGPEGGQAGGGLRHRHRRGDLPVGKLRYKDDVMVIGNGEIGPLSQKLYDTVTGIQLGRLEDKFGWRVRVD